MGRVLLVAAATLHTMATAATLCVVAICNLQAEHLLASFLTL